MQKCWDDDPSKRYTFEKVIEYLENDSKDSHTSMIQKEGK